MIPFEKATLRESTLAQEGALLISKIFKLPVLMDVDELRQLFSDLKEGGHLFQFFYAQGICPKGEGKIAEKTFLDGYASYIDQLKKGLIPSTESYRGLFSSMMTQEETMIYAVVVDEQRQILKTNRPVVQLQMHDLHFSAEEQTFRSMSYGQESICWGIQFFYPQLYQDPKTQDIHTVKESPLFPNTSLFKAIQRWVRHHTLPTPFVVNHVKQNCPIRLGKGCFSWINHHPQLIQKGIYVEKHG